MKRRSTSYIVTVKMINGQVALEDQRIVEIIKKTVEVSNTNYGTTYSRVKLQGRLGENNPNAWKYRRGSWKIGGYGNCQSVRLADAQHADVYVYDRT
jgi:hypothetical protein